MDKDTASPPHYYSVGAPPKVEPPPTVVLVPQPTSVEAQIGYDYQLQRQCQFHCMCAYGWPRSLVLTSSDGEVRKGRAPGVAEVRRRGHHLWGRLVPGWHAGDVVGDLSCLGGGRRMTLFYVY